MKQVIQTANAPSAIGTYSQAVRCDNLVYLSGQIGLNPESMELVGEYIELEVAQVFDNIQAVCEASGGTLDDIIKLTVYLKDLDHAPRVNEAMTARFQAPYPARVMLGVSTLPRGASVEIEALLKLA